MKILPATGCALTFAATLPLSLQADRLPHIILLMTDQQRWDAMGCTSGGIVVTPHLDRLAAEGTRFAHAYTSCPSSTPARSGLLTGLSPWHHGLLGYGDVAEHCRFEMPRLLRELGYYTFGIGKMHWHPQRTKHGFHEVLLDESGRVEDENFVSDYRQWFQLHCPGGNPDATGIGWNDHGAAVYVPDEALHPTRWTGETACELIRSYDTATDTPLFLKVSFARPHSPYDPPKRWLDLYEEKEIPPCVVYAGGLHEKFGVLKLVQAFTEADIPNYELKLYGSGQAVEKMKELSKENLKIKYMGVVPVSEIEVQERRAVLLVNPRPTSEEFTKYSFPSKTLEYMVSGTPLLTTMLPGIPKEYFDYVYTFGDETVKGMRDTLCRVLNFAPDDLKKKGMAGKDFVLKEKNNVIQGEKIVDFMGKV